MAAVPIVDGDGRPVARRLPPGRVAYWTVPPLWAGRTVMIAGGGPSLRADQLRAGRAAGWRIIGVNNAGIMPGVPVDCLYFGDERFYQWNRDAVDAFDGLKVTMDNRGLPGVRCLRNEGAAGCTATRWGVKNGRNSGYQAMQLGSVLLGASRLVLVGFDMRAGADGRTHFHDRHQRMTDPTVYRRRFLPHFPKLAAELEARGVEVLNATPGSALGCWPIVDLVDAIARWGASA